MARPHAHELVESLIDFAYVVGTSIASRAQSVIARVRGDGPMEGEQSDDGYEEMDAELWGDAPMLYRPADPTNAGSCEGMFVRRGDTRDVIATKDRRWQVSLEKGEVYLRWMGDLTDAVNTRPIVHLKNDGTVLVSGVKIVLDASDVRLGGDTASAYVALANLVKDRLDTIQSLFNAHTHTGGTISGNTGAPQVAQQMPTFASVAASRVKATS